MARSTSAEAQRALLVRLIEQGFDSKSWHGPNLKSTIRLVKPDLAAWRPKKGHHSIAEIVLHCAYWKYAVRRRILKEKRGSFPLKGSNWFVVSGKLSSAEWKNCARILSEEHTALLEAVSNAPWSRICDGPGGGSSKPADHVFGAAYHDVYHAGQIQKIKALRKRR